MFHWEFLKGNLHRFTLLLLTAAILFTLSPEAFAKKPPKPPKSPRLATCETFLTPGIRAPGEHSDKTRWAYNTFRSLRSGLPAQVGDFFDSRKGQTVADLVMDIMNIRRQLGLDLLSMADHLEDEPITKSLILNGSRSVMPASKEMASAQEMSQKLGQNHWHQMSKKKRQKAVNRIVNFYNPLRSKLDEVAIAFEVPDVVSVNPRVRAAFPEEHKDAYIMHKGRDLAQKELDVIFKNGRAWGEVKSSISGWTWPGAIKSLTAQAIKMMKAAHAVSDMTGEPIEIHYFFLGQKPPHKTLCLFERWGIILHWAPHIDNYSYPSVLDQLNCPAEAA